MDTAASEGKEPEYGVHLDIASYGDISSFFWAHSQPPPPGLVECDVAYGARSLRRVAAAQHLMTMTSSCLCIAARWRTNSLHFSTWFSRTGWREVDGLPSSS